MIMLLVAIALAPATAISSDETQTPPAGIGLIGASATAGWGVIVPLDKPSEGRRFRHVTLARALEAIDQDLPGVVTKSGDPFFFRKRNATRALQMDAVIEARPEAVIGVDVLFWYAYGNVAGVDKTTRGAARAARLEEGLTQLDRIVALGIPLIVGDLPDMSGALEAKPFAFLRANQVPAKDTLKALNERIHAWAAERPDVHLLPLAELIATMQEGKGVTAGGVSWGPDPRLLQHDRLHPTDEGLLALAAVVSQQLEQIRAPGAELEPVDKAAARAHLRSGAAAP
ncbi:MAG: hypothetical protein MK101_06615 [Phycisphaerales bacterium]|nr:hypothetical protein [Phycisphaerales bacterium]